MPKVSHHFIDQLVHKIDLPQTHAARPNTLRSYMQRL